METLLEYRSRLARMQASAGPQSLNATIAKAKAWVADEKWLPTPDLKDVLRRLVEAVEGTTEQAIPVVTPEARKAGDDVAHPDALEDVAPAKPKAKRGRPRKVIE